MSELTPGSVPTFGHGPGRAAWGDMFRKTEPHTAAFLCYTWKPFHAGPQRLAVAVRKTTNT
jgi:hypothetical protein